MHITVAAAAISFVVVYLAVPPSIRWLESRGMCVPDVLKKGRPMIARPGGPAILCGIVPAGLLVFWYTNDWGVVALLVTAGAACAIGYVDDRRVMSGWFKPAALCVAAIPLVLAGSYDTALTFPPFGEVQIPILYVGIILIMIPITGNTINSIDVMNGVASGYMVIAGSALAIVLAMLGRWEVFTLSIILVAASLAFYRYHKIPSRIFPGDSGALLLGAMYGGISIMGGVEVVAAAALLPAIANSFFYLYSTRGMVEHRQIKHKDVVLDDDLRLMDSGDPQAPISLVRLILKRGPMSEPQVARVILKMGVFASVLAVITGLMMVLIPG